MRKVEPLPTRGCEAGYGPASMQSSFKINTLTDYMIRNVFLDLHIFAT